MGENLMGHACDSTERFVERVTPDQYDLPTPCSEWDVRALLNHLVSTLALGEALLSDEAPTVDAEPGGLPRTDLLDGDPLKAYRSGAERLLEAATVEAINRPHRTPLGEMPGAALAGFTTLDVLVHGWDLAKATGQDPTLDPALAEHVLAFARGTIDETMGTRSPRIGPEIPTGEGASATDRLVAFLGRHP